MCFISEDLSLIQRDRNAVWFSEADGASILLSSEIGGEGRNFQFAQHLVLFDLPFEPEVLEQRIGRLDRIGQASEIFIHIPYLKNSPEEILIRWYHDGLNAFAENFSGGYQALEAFEGRIRSLIKMESQSRDTALNDLLEETAIFRKELLERLVAGRNRLLELSSFVPTRAQKVIEDIEDLEKNKRILWI